MKILKSLEKLQIRLQKKFITLNRIEISKEAILNNFDTYQNLFPHQKIIPVLKSNAYGHGLEIVAEILKNRTFPYIAVDGYFEALQTRAITKQPILIMGYILPDNYRVIEFDNYTFAVHDSATITALGETGKKIKVHLELETGMGRHGISEKDIDHIIFLLMRYQNLEVEGVMSHLADADNSDSSYTDFQVKRFDESIKKFKKAGFNPTLYHIGQTAGSLKVKSKFANTIRLGIGLYGINPLSKNDSDYHKLKSLQPALQIISTITKINQISRGESISYNHTFIAKRPTNVGIIPIGYYEGLPRELSNHGHVLWRKKLVPIIGHINMNHAFIDLTDTRAKVGDEVVILGGNQEEITSLNNISNQYQISQYVLLAKINKNLRRIIVKKKSS